MLTGGGADRVALREGPVSGFVNSFYTHSRLTGTLSTEAKQPHFKPGAFISRARPDTRIKSSAFRGLADVRRGIKREAG